MITFIIGLVILFVGAALYGKFCEHVFGPDDPGRFHRDGMGSRSHGRLQPGPSGG